MSVAAPQLITAEDLSELSKDGRDYEIVDGVLKEVLPVGAYESKLEFLVARHLQSYVDAGKASGEVLPASARFRLCRDPDIVRGPDASFTPSGKLPPGPLPDTHLDLAPDLAVEIVSKSNTAEEIERKIIDYLQAGVRMVWVIYPETRTAYLYTSMDKVQRIEESGELDGGDAMPGFRLKLAQLFQEAGKKIG
jgi:Uma2 family endonuclease